MATTRAKVTYHSKSCGRCGGTGQYHAYHVQDTTCFSCRGTGRILLPSAQKAQKALREFRASLCQVPVEQVKTGDRVRDFRGAMVVTVGAYATLTQRDVVKFETKGIRHGYNVGSKVELLPTDEQWQQVVAFARTLKGVTVED